MDLFGLLLINEKRPQFLFFLISTFNPAYKGYHCFIAGFVAGFSPEAFVEGP